MKLPTVVVVPTSAAESTSGSQMKENRIPSLITDDVTLILKKVYRVRTVCSANQIVR